MTVPYWVQDAVFYQIFPDRFANGNSSNDPPNAQKWGAPPTVWGFQGGDLRGIIQRFDYLLDLGINAIYLNPIFHSPSNHRYNTLDYYKIDPRLGDMVDFHALLDIAHRNNVRILLDGVFNDTARGFFAFNDVLKNGDHSAYKNWYHIHRFPLDAFTPGDAANYEAWWKIKSLPKLNTSNPEVRRYIMGVARYWIERGIDGWRLDVPNEIDDDDFWAEFRHVVKKANRDAYILGEIWEVDPRWANDTHFDGLMHYPVKNALLPLLNGHDRVDLFAEKVEALLKAYPRENVYAMYVPLDSHDTERFLTLLNGNTQKLKLAFQFIFAYPGAPAIYYGDEVGLEGGKDPDCRRAFPWDPADWKTDLRLWIQALIAVRKARPSLRRGDYTRLLADPDTGVYAFARILGGEKTVVVLNSSSQRRDLQIPVQALHLPPGQPLRSLIDSRPFNVEEGKVNITLDAWHGLMLG